jgi:hypothetical protein
MPNYLEPIFEANKRDNPRTDSGGWIQWKGTKACIDLHCVCGFDGHVDTDYFFYRAYCPNCGRQFLVGQNIKLIELTDEEAAVDFHEPQSIQLGDWTLEDEWASE